MLNYFINGFTAEKRVNGVFAEASLQIGTRLVLKKLPEIHGRPL
jgi:16S rRNA G1207 methylase RsmC